MNKNPPISMISPMAISLSLVSIFASLYMVLHTNLDSVYATTCILPFYFGIISLPAGYLYRNLSKSPVSIFLFGGYFIRMVIHPLLFCMGGYVSFYNIIISQQNVFKAIILLCLENTFVFLVANYYSRLNQFTTNRIKIEPKKYDTRLVGCIIVLLGLFLLYAYVTIPSLKSIYLFLPTADISQLANIRWDNETIVARGSISRYIYSLFTFIWPIVRAILPAFCISQIYTRYGNSGSAIVLSVLCLFIPSIFLGGDNIAPFTGAIFGLIVMHRLYGKKINIIIYLSCFIFGSAFITVVSSKLMQFQNWRGADGISSIAQIINAYFPGLENIAICFTIKDTNKINTLFFDLYYAIPFKETLFGLSGDNLSTLFTQTSQTGAQIVPWASQLSHYFTILGSPLISALLVSCAYKSELVSKYTCNFWMYYKKMYFSVLTALSIHIYSFSIYIRSYLNVLLPIMIIIWIGNKTKNLSKSTD